MASIKNVPLTPISYSDDGKFNNKSNNSMLPMLVSKFSGYGCPTIKEFNFSISVFLEVLFAIL